MPLTQKELAKKAAERLRSLRRTHGEDMSPEDISIRAKEDRNIKIGARTIRDMEDPSTHNPQVDKLHALLSYYNVTLGDFYRFTLEDQQSRLIATFLEVIKDKAARQIIDTVFEVYGARD